MNSYIYQIIQSELKQKFMLILQEMLSKLGDLSYYQ